jgi:hypothetical protein
LAGRRRAVRDNLELAGREHFLGNLAAGLEAGAGQGDAALGAGQLHVEVLAVALAVARREHDEAALGAGDVDRRVEHERQDLIEDAARAEGTQGFEQRRELAEIVDRAGVRSIGVRGTVAGQEHHVGAAGATELDAIAVGQLVLGDRLAVDVGAVTRPLVAQDPVAVLLDDLGVLARHVAADQTEIALRASADAEQLLVNRDDALTEAVVYFQPGVWLSHMQEGFIIAGYRRPLPGPPLREPVRAG